MENLEKIIKKSKNILGAALFSAATLYNCQNPANPEISKPKTEITKPENYSPENPVKKNCNFIFGRTYKNLRYGT